MNLGIYLLLFLMMGSVAWGQEENDFLEADFLDLMNVELVSASRRPAKASETAAAVYVINSKEIAQAGYKSVAEALRTAPGVYSAPINGYHSGVSIRGYGDIFADKLLVMIDGRSVYNPTFSGVFWDLSFVNMKDIDRIEVIRGPGGSLWGANAVNGVVNIITKKAGLTDGGNVSVGFGTHLNYETSVDYQQKLSEKLSYRVYALAQDWDENEALDGGGAHDGWSSQRGGFRLDWDPDLDSTISVTGDFAYLREDERQILPVLTAPYEETIDNLSKVRSAYLSALWTRHVDENNRFDLRVSFSDEQRKTTVFNETHRLYELEFQHEYLMENQVLLWGMFYRLSQTEMAETEFLSFDPRRRESQLVSFFVQDEISLKEDELSLTIGSKFEHNDFTGFEFQPTARLAWTPVEKYTIWTAVSRAVQTPAQGFTDIRLRNDVLTDPPLLAGTPSWVIGNDDLEAEVLYAYELGIRGKLSDRFTADLALFYNDYHTQKSFDQQGVNARLDNFLYSQSYGAELALNYQVKDYWILKGSYSYIKVDGKIKQESTDPFSIDDIEGGAPNHMLKLQSLWQINKSWHLYSSFYYLDNVTSTDTESIFDCDLSLNWQASKSLSFSLQGRHLLDSSQQHFSSRFVGIDASNIERSVALFVNYSF